MTLDRTYDAADRLSSVSSSVSGQPTTVVSSFTYQLDARGRRVKRTDLDGTWIDYAYNNRNELIAAERSNYPADNPYGNYPYDYEYQFDSIGNHLKQTKNGTQINGRYNNLNQLLEREIAGEVTVQGTADGEVPIGVKVDGRAADTANIDTDTDAYRGASIIRDRETGEKTISVVATDSHDPPRRTSSTVTANLPDTNPVEYTYDLNGNMIGDGIWQYTWNDENRLTAIETPPGTPASSRARITCTYDHQGRRRTKKVYSWDEQAEEWVLDSELLFLYDRWNLVAEISVDAGQLTVDKTYTWGTDLSGTLQGAGGVGGLLSCSTSSGPSFYSYDGNGNVTALVNADTGAISASYDYAPFGKTVSMSGTAAADNTFRFSTKYHDPETRLVYYGYRYYEPGLGRWMSRDPIGEKAGGVSLHAFVQNRPIADADLFGMMASCMKICKCCCADNIESPIFQLADPYFRLDGHKVEVPFDSKFVTSSACATDTVSKPDCEAWTEENWLKSSVGVHPKGWKHGECILLSVISQN